MFFQIAYKIRVNNTRWSHVEVKIEDKQKIHLKIRTRFNTF